MMEVPSVKTVFCSCEKMSTVAIIKSFASVFSCFVVYIRIRNDSLNIRSMFKTNYFFYRYISSPILLYKKAYTEKNLGTNNQKFVFIKSQNY